jgi:hypothetical protein
MFNDDDCLCGEDRFYQLTPKAVRFLKLQRRYENGSIMGHEARERLLLIEELNITLSPEEHRGYNLAEQLEKIFREGRIIA